MIAYTSDAPGSQSIPAGFELLFPDAVAQIAANDFRGDFLTVVGNTASQALIDAYLEACDTHVPELHRVPLAVPGNGMIAPDLRRSDHARFWDAGIPALMLTDGADTRNGNYHTPNDVVATLDLDFLTACTKATLAAAAQLAMPINAGSDTRALGVVGMADHLHRFPCIAEVYPNPVQDELQLHISACAGQRVVARLFDLRGAQVAGRDLVATGGREVFSIPLPNTAAGVHMLVLQVGESSTNIKVMLQP